MGGWRAVGGCAGARTDQAAAGAAQRQSTHGEEQEACRQVRQGWGGWWAGAGGRRRKAVNGSPGRTLWTRGAPVPESSLLLPLTPLPNQTHSFHRHPLRPTTGRPSRQSSETPSLSGQIRAVCSGTPTLTLPQAGLQTPILHRPSQGAEPPEPHPSPCRTCRWPSCMCRCWGPASLYDCARSDLKHQRAGGGAWCSTATSLCRARRGGLRRHAVLVCAAELCAPRQHRWGNHAAPCMAAPCTPPMPIRSLHAFTPHPYIHMCSLPPPAHSHLGIALLEAVGCLVKLLQGLGLLGAQEAKGGVGIALRSSHMQGLLA